MTVCGFARRERFNTAPDYKRRQVASHEAKNNISFGAQSARETIQLRAQKKKLELLLDS